VRISFFLFSIFGACSAFGQAGAFAEADPRYRVQPNDTFEVRYRYTPEFDQTVTVQPDGFVALQVIGDLKVQDKTIDQIKAAILGEATNYLKDPEITIILKDFQKAYFTVGGEVANPGRFEMRGAVSPIQAIAIAGGFKGSSAKNSQVILFRRAGPDLAAAELLDLSGVMQGARSETFPDLHPGDMLVVPQNRISKIERYVKWVSIGSYIPF
jgi:polysaccharide export outer membrane protein